MFVGWLEVRDLLCKYLACLGFIHRFLRRRHRLLLLLVTDCDAVARAASRDGIRGARAHPRLLVGEGHLRALPNWVVESVNFRQGQRLERIGI